MRSISTTEKRSYPFPVQSGWHWTNLAAIAYKLTDGAHHTPDYVAQGVPFLSVKDMSGGKIDFSDTRFISEDEHDKLYKRCNAEQGDLLITKVGTTGIPVVVDTHKKFSLFVSVALVKAPWDLISVDYLRLLVDSPLVKKQSADGTQGIGNKNLVLRTIADFQIPIAPLAEQHRIVSKVGKLMADCEQIKSKIAQGLRQQMQFADSVSSQSVA